MSLKTCTACGGFSPTTTNSCVHCGVAATSVPSTPAAASAPRARSTWKLLGRGAALVTGGAALSLTLMACYGSPPCEDCAEGDGEGEEGEGDEGEGG